MSLLQLDRDRTAKWLLDKYTIDYPRIIEEDPIKQMNDIYSWSKGYAT